MPKQKVISEWMGDAKSTIQKLIDHGCRIVSHSARTIVYEEPDSSSDPEMQIKFLKHRLEEVQATMEWSNAKTGGYLKWWYSETQRLIEKWNKERESICDQSSRSSKSLEVCVNDLQAVMQSFPPHR